MSHHNRLRNAFILSLQLAALSFLVGCGRNDIDPDTSPDQSPPTDFSDKYAAVLEGYFALSEVFTQSDAEAAAQSASALANLLEDAGTDDLRGETARFWENRRTALLDRARNIAERDDVEDQRYQFEHLSSSMIQVAERFRSPGPVIYVQRCPMVRGGSADWLSPDPGIRNPYHGDRMMNCGTTLSEIH